MWGLNRKSQTKIPAPSAFSLCQRPSPLQTHLLCLSPSSSSLLNRDLEELQELATSSNTNPRIFPYNVKQQCWEKAEKIRGRDPDRWRRVPDARRLPRLPLS
ncbi:hypothetical protein CerSpe_030760 [Prunus speciosa]